MPTVLDITIRIPRSIARFTTRLVRLFSPLAHTLKNGGFNSFVFISQLIAHMECTFLVYLYMSRYPLSDFRLITGLPLLVGYLYSFGLIIGWIGFLYVSCGIAIGQLYFPPLIPTVELSFFFRCDTYPTGHPLAPTIQEHREIWQWVRFMKLILNLGRIISIAIMVMALVVVGRRGWKWANFSAEFWMESFAPVALVLPMDNFPALENRPGHCKY